MQKNAYYFVNQVFAVSDLIKFKEKDEEFKTVKLEVENFKK